MSIETLMTLGLTAVLLAVAFVLRLVVLTLLRVGLRLAGKDTAWLRPQRSEREPRSERPVRPRRESAAGLRPRVTSAAGKARSGLSVAGTALLAAAATIWTAAARAAVGLERWADATNERLAPAMADIRSGARRATADMGKYLVAGIATLQHLGGLIAGGLRSLTQRSSTEQPDAAQKVIRLDRHDEPADPSPPRSRRNHSVGV